MLAQVAQQLQPQGGDGFEHGLDSEARDVGLVHRLTRSSPVPSLGKPLAHVRHTAHDVAGRQRRNVLLQLAPRGGLFFKVSNREFVEDNEI